VVDINVGRVGATVRIKVGDREPGIHPDDLPMLFQPFFRCQPTDNARNTVDGDGLSFVIARRVSDAHDRAIGDQHRDGGLAVTP
jgi:K+-sensing histidine kinase KdpD